MLSFFKLNSGIGSGKYNLTSFDAALMNAGFGNYNLVRVSSILPANSIKQDHVSIKEGEPLYIAYGSHTSNECGKTIASAVCVGIPKDISKIGVIMEASGFYTQPEIEIIAKNMVQESMEIRGYDVHEYLISSTEYTIPDNLYHTVFSGIALW